MTMNEYDSTVENDRERMLSVSVRPTTEYIAYIIEKDRNEYNVSTVGKCYERIRTIFRTSTNPHQQRCPHGVPKSEPKNNTSIRMSINQRQRPFVGSLFLRGSAFQRRPPSCPPPQSSSLPPSPQSLQPSIQTPCHFPDSGIRAWRERCPPSASSLARVKLTS